MGNFVKVTVYIPIELKEYLKQREISISSWCREAINKKKLKFERMKEKYHTEPEYRDRRLEIRKRSYKKNGT